MTLRMELKMVVIDYEEGPYRALTLKDYKVRFD